MGNVVRIVVFLGLALSFGTSGSTAETATLTRVFAPSSQNIPLVIVQSPENKMTVRWIKIEGEPASDLESTENNSQSLFQIRVAGAEDNQNTAPFESQLWLSALMSAKVLQQPWMAVRWTVTDAPSQSAVAAGAALGVALVATTTGTDYPPDLAILGRLQPDGSLGAVDRLPERMKAAAEAGLTRILIPRVQSFELVEGQNPRNNIELARRLGLECLVADTLGDAITQVLRRDLPEAPRGDFLPRYSLELSEALEEKCRALAGQLRVQSDSWPRTDAQLKPFSQTERKLWKRADSLYALSQEAYRSGRLYVAYRLMRQADALSAGLWEARATADKFNFQSVDQRGTEVLRQLAAEMTKPAVDRDELQSALLLAEENDWMQGLTSSVEGAQIIARQAFDARSEASPAQKKMAQILLVTSVAAAERQLIDRNFLRDNLALLIRKDPLPTYDRAHFWAEPLRAVQLGVAESFIAGLRARSNEWGDRLLFDVDLGGFERVLQGYRAQWEASRNELALNPSRQLEAVEIGFVPGSGFNASRATRSTVLQRNLSDTAADMIWANDFSALASLNEKYHHLGMSFDGESFSWRVQNAAALQNLLQIADTNARRDLALAASVGLDTTILSLVYETASTLSASADNDLRLEGLRQYWRGSLLGNLAWQMGYVPRAIGAGTGQEPASSTEPVRLSPTPAPALLHSVANASASLDVSRRSASSQ